ncbi:hypothetical protein [Photobacterium sanguinicancri]|uniref:Uncharacterized protein n=1 Tax=Photobacterium sanguinicancri TaxID=875932 RepID=A0ABX4G0D6_9GAMM|nr:hypothetical protein [Photobacterium sanguinicancri]OZS43540.1 hypothetical protein ASV53_12825 [Photobacterium sanguinicancri]
MGRIDIHLPFHDHILFEQINALKGWHTGQDRTGQDRTGQDRTGNEAIKKGANKLLSLNTHFIAK